MQFSNMKSSTLLWAGIIVVALLAAGAYYYPSQNDTQTLAGSPVGTTFNTAKVAAINWTLSTGATTTSVLNSDASDRYVKAIEMGCEAVGTSQTPLTGVGLLALTIKAATTSSASPAVISNAHVIGNSGFTLATSTPTFVIASSTVAGPAGSSDIANIWAAGSYMTFWSNATNTAVCTVGVTYLAS